MEGSSATRYVPPYNIAMACNGLKDYDGALHYLHLAAEQNDVRLRYLPVDPLWREMNDDPRVRKLWPLPQRHLKVKNISKL